MRGVMQSRKMGAPELVRPLPPLASNQTRLTRAGLLTHAKALNLNLPAFQQALDNHTYRPVIERGLAEADGLGAGLLRRASTTRSSGSRRGTADRGAQTPEGERERRSDQRERGRAKRGRGFPAVIAWSPGAWPE